MDKPVVTFKRFVGVGKHPYSQEPNAALEGVEGHPKLGDESISTRRGWSASATTMTERCVRSRRGTRSIGWLTDGYHD